MTSQPGGRPPGRPGARPAAPGARGLDLRGAVDLGALAAPPAAAKGAAGGAAGGASGGGDTDPHAGTSPFVKAVTEASFAADVIQVSDTVPVVLDFWATWCGPCRQLSPLLESLADEFGGRFLLATIDVDQNKQLAGAFQVQSIPSVFAVVRGQPLPLFQGAQPEAQIRAVLTELLRVAAANGVDGVLTGATEVVSDDDAEPEEEPLPPLHQVAYDAIERDDLDAAAAAYEQALKESPADDEARLGLAQVQLMQRTRDADLVQARAAAAADPADVAAQILVADIDILGGHVDDAFGRLIDTVKITAGPEREQVRKHLILLFEVVGASDPRVGKARLSLANALF